MFLDPDPHSQYGSESKTDKSMRIRIHNIAYRIGRYQLLFIPFPSDVDVEKRKPGRQPQVVIGNLSPLSEYG
jgi:hypothetical protein